MAPIRVSGGCSRWGGYHFNYDWSVIVPWVSYCHSSWYHQEEFIVSHLPVQARSIKYWWCTKSLLNFLNNNQPCLIHHETTLPQIKYWNYLKWNNSCITSNTCVTQIHVLLSFISNERKCNCRVILICTTYWRQLNYFLSPILILHWIK